MFYSRQQLELLQRRFGEKAVHHYSPRNLRYFGRQRSVSGASPLER